MLVGGGGVRGAVEQWRPPVSLSFGGSAAHATEQALNSGSSSLILTLDGDSWSAGVGVNEADTAPLVAAFTSLHSNEPSGWAAVVTPVLSASMVVRTSAHELTIGLPVLPCYDILAPEVVTLSVPSTAIASGRQVVAPPLRVLADTSQTPPQWGSASSAPIEEWRNCTHIRVRWAAPAHMGGSELVHYRLEVSSSDAAGSEGLSGADGSPSSGAGWSVGSPINGTSALFGPLLPGRAYAVRVRPYNRGSGCSPVPGSAGVASSFIGGWRADDLHVAAGPASGGAVSGGMRVIVGGACMLAGNGSSCVWGDDEEATRTAVLASNESELTCLTPAVDGAGTVQLRLALNRTEEDGEAGGATGGEARDSGLQLEFYQVAPLPLNPSLNPSTNSSPAFSPTHP